MNPSPSVGRVAERVAQTPRLDRLKLIWQPIGHMGSNYPLSETPWAVKHLGRFLFEITAARPDGADGQLQQTGAGTFTRP